MCLIKGREDQACIHPTCLESVDNDDFYSTTMKALFLSRDDFSKVTLSGSANNEIKFIRVPNPHRRNTDTWRSFEEFRNNICTVRAVGEWPDRQLFKKPEIDFQYYLYARKIPEYNPLKDDYDFSLVLDVEEAAVYCGEL